MAAEITFALSSFGIVGMLFLKSFELRTGKTSPMTKVSESSNAYVRRVYTKTRRFISYFNKQNGVLLLRFLIIHAIIYYRRTGAYIKGTVMSHPSAQKMHDMVTGKGVVKKKGAVSFFLKRIAEEAQEAEVATVESLAK